MGDWVLENAKGDTDFADADPEECRRHLSTDPNRGGALAVSGDYKLEGSRLVKLAKPNDPYWEMTWHYASGRLKLRKKGDYKDWMLTRKAWKPRS